jgi:hypothetical protein
MNSITETPTTERTLTRVKTPGMEGMSTARLVSLTRPPGEEGNPLHSPDVSSTRLRGGPDTTLQVTS